MGKSFLANLQSRVKYLVKTLTLNPSRHKDEKINFYFHKFFWYLKRFYENLFWCIKGFIKVLNAFMKLFEAPQRSENKKLIFTLIQLFEMHRAGRIKQNHMGKSQCFFP